MALAGTAPSDPQSTLKLASNNPFRNRTTSPVPRLQNGLPAPRPISTNPFLDNGDEDNTGAVRENGANGESKSGATAQVTDVPTDIFNDLSLLDKSTSNGPPPPYRPGPSRVGTNPSQVPRLGTFNEHWDRPRDLPRGPDSPGRREHRPSHSRRASESSIMDREKRPREDRDRTRDRDRTDRPPRTESEERRRRERRREREERHKKEKERSRKGSDRPPRKPRGLDIIDKLDVTGIYGQGLFHHDGPFDACNPHRNAKKDRAAPMQAFPAGSMNMAIGGSGPVRNNIDLELFHGRGVEGFSEFATTRKAATQIVDPTAKTEPVHGEESYGLGTSTFLEGAPASRKALLRRQSEDDPADGNLNGGLSRKKSIAQRFRGMSATRRIPGEIRTPDGQFANGSADLETSPPRVKAVSAGGIMHAKFTKENEINPFDNDYEKAYEKKGSQIKIVEQDKPTGDRSRPLSSPRASVVPRSQTIDAGVVARGSNEEERSLGASGGFLNRMKSLKGGPRKPSKA